MNKGPSYDLRECKLSVVADLCAKYHGYKSSGSAAVYSFAVYENGTPVAGYTWQPPPPGSAVSVCKAAPSGVLSLSRMVATPREERALRHISKPLRRQMMRLIDRGRWPSLVTYSDEGQGHTGHVYKCSGWAKTTRTNVKFYVNAEGRRASSYAGGVNHDRPLTLCGTTTIQRWEHHICPPEEAAEWMKAHGWRRVPIEGKRWASGKQAHKWVLWEEISNEKKFDYLLTERKIEDARSVGQVSTALGFVR